VRFYILKEQKSEIFLFIFIFKDEINKISLSILKNESILSSKNQN